eukprot:SAG31_NODE_1302_length_8900_cov_4.460857_3_plen_57_part_00
MSLATSRIAAFSSDTVAEAATVTSSVRSIVTILTVIDNSASLVTTSTNGEHSVTVC